MNLKTSLVIHKYGYYPKGMGEVAIEVKPNRKLSSILLKEFGKIEELHGISVCTFLEDRKVAERQANAAINYLRSHGFGATIEIINDKSNPLQKGSSLVMWAKTSSGAFLGGDAIGELGKPSETVGKEAAENLLREIEAKATVDIHLADMLIPYVALANASSAYLTRDMTDHLETNIWLAEKILDTKFHVTRVGDLHQIEKKGS
jgi:RNA 3'-terminal phosphate cyclase (ATP)